MLKSCLILVLLGAIQATYAAPADSIDCAKFDAVMEDQGASQGLSFTNDKYVRPTTKEELDKRCPEMNESLKVLKQYNQKCNTALTQQVMSAVFKSRQVFNDKMCKEDPAEETQKKLETIKCLKDNALNQIKSAEEKTIILSQVLHETEIKDEKERLKRACCSVIQTKEDLAAAVKPACEKHLKSFLEYVDSYTSESMQIICPDAEKMAKDGECAKLTPLKLEGVKPKYTFFVTPLVKVVKTLDH